MEKLEIPARGLRAYIYRDTYRSGSNVFTGYDTVTIIGRTPWGERVAPVTTPTKGAPAVILGETTPGHLVAWPVDKGNRWLMFGGSFIWTGDSRMPGRAKHPIPLHDTDSAVDLCRPRRVDTCGVSGWE